MEGEEQDIQCSYNVTSRRVSSLGKRSAFLKMTDSTDSEEPVRNITFPSVT